MMFSPSSHRFWGSSVAATVLLLVCLAPAAAGNKISGTVKMPVDNGPRDFQSQFSKPQRSEISVYLQRVNGKGEPAGEIGSGRTWIVIHGRNCKADAMRSLAAAIAERRASDQVLMLDWEQGASDNGPLGSLGLNGSAWTPLVAKWADATLRSLGVRAEDLSLVGHSWGAYVAYGMACGWEGTPKDVVRNIIALDPALCGNGVPFQSFNFAAVTRRSWAFFGAGICGSPSLVTTAHEAFALEYDGSPSESERHMAPVQLFERLVRESGKPTDLFSLARLDAATTRPWQPKSAPAHSAALRAVAGCSHFDAVFCTGRSAHGAWDVVQSLNYSETAPGAPSRDDLLPRMARTDGVLR